MRGEYRKSKLTKNKIVKGVNGAISIFLCIIITPFLTITLGLVEYARYQEVISITEELMELTGLSVLSDYDVYLHDRFGLLATSQDGELDDGIEKLLSENLKLLGKQTTLTTNSTSVSGKYALSEMESMRRQIISVGELTAPAAVLVEDLQLDELLEKLNEITAFANITKTFNKMKEVTDSLTDATEKLNDLKNSITSLKTQIDTLKTNTVDFTGKLKALYVAIGTTEGIALPEGYTQEDLLNAVDNFASLYLDDIKDISVSANSVYESINAVKSGVSDISSKITAFETSVNGVRDKINEVSKDSDESDKVEKSNEVALQTVDAVVEEMESLINGSLKEIKTNAIQTAETTLNTIYNNVTNESGLKDILSRYESIANGTYFDGLPLSKSETKDLKNFIEKAYSLYETKGEANLSEYFTELFVPDLSQLQLNTLLEEAESVVKSAESKFLNETLEKAVELINQLTSLLKSLCSLELFYNSDLNAFVDIGNGLEDNPYQKFLESVGNIFSAVETLGNAIIGNASLVDALRAFGTIFSSIATILQSIFTIAWQSFSGVFEVVKNIAGGNGAIYEQLVIASYMRHNLSNRTNAGDSSLKSDGTDVTYETELSGSGLTLFEYKNIPRPTRNITNEIQTGGLLNLVNFINDMKAGSGDDSMFIGAELEYMLVGTNSELVNQTMVFLQIYALRFILDLPSIFTDSFTTSVAAAATIGALVVYLLYMLIEPLLDTVLLVNGGEVPLVRTKCWITPTGFVKYVEKFSELVTSNEEVKQVITSEGEKVTNKLKEYSSVTDNFDSTGIAETGYETHLLLLLLSTTSSDTLVKRFQNIVELEAKEYYSQKDITFSLDKSYTGIQLEADITFNPFFDVGTYASGTPLDMKARIKQSVAY